MNWRQTFQFHLILTMIVPNQNKNQTSSSSEVPRGNEKTSDAKSAKKEIDFSFDESDLAKGRNHPQQAHPDSDAFDLSAVDESVDHSPEPAEEADSPDLQLGPTPTVQPKSHADQTDSDTAADPSTGTDPTGTNSPIEVPTQAHRRSWSSESASAGANQSSFVESQSRPTTIDAEGSSPAAAEWTQQQASELISLREERDALRRENHALREDANALQQEWTTTKNELERARRELEQRPEAGQFEAVQKELTAAYSQVDSLKEEVNHLTNELGKVQHQCEQQREQQESISELLDEWQTKAEQLQAELSDSSARADSAQRELDEARKEKESFQSGIDELNDQLATANNEIDRLERSLQDSESRWQEKVVELEKQRDAETQRCEQLESDLAEADQAIAKSSNESISRVNDEIVQKLNRKRFKLTLVKNKLREKLDQIAELQAQIGRQEMELNELRQHPRQDTSDRQIEQLQRQVDQLNEKLKNHKAIKAKLSRQKLKIYQLKSQMENRQTEQPAPALGERRSANSTPTLSPKSV